MDYEERFDPNPNQLTALPFPRISWPGAPWEDIIENYWNFDQSFGKKINMNTVISFESTWSFFCIEKKLSI